MFELGQPVIGAVRHPGAAAAVERARRRDEEPHRVADGVGQREEERERRIADEPVQPVAAQEHAVAAPQRDDRERGLDVVSDAERLEEIALETDWPGLFNETLRPQDEGYRDIPVWCF